MLLWLFRYAIGRSPVASRIRGYRERSSPGCCKPEWQVSSSVPFPGTGPQQAAGLRGLNCPTIRRQALLRFRLSRHSPDPARHARERNEPRGISDPERRLFATEVELHARHKRGGWKDPRRKVAPPRGWSDKSLEPRRRQARRSVQLPTDSEDPRLRGRQD